jgi:hypothetical protein
MTRRSLRVLLFFVATALGAAISVIPATASAQCTGQYYVVTATLPDYPPGCTTTTYDAYSCDNVVGPSPGGVACCPGFCNPVPANTCTPACPCDPLHPQSPACDPVPPVHPPTEDACLGNPFTTSNGDSHIEAVDVSIPGALGGLQFKRTYSSSPNDWLDGLPFLETPSPFGASAADLRAPLWSHSALALVTIWPSNPGAPETWSVRDRNGQYLGFVPCTGALPCWRQSKHPSKTPKNDDWICAVGKERGATCLQFSVLSTWRISRLQVLLDAGEEPGGTHSAYSDLSGSHGIDLSARRHRVSWSAVPL